MSDKLREAAEQAEELLAEIVRRHIDDLLPRENFFRECNATATALRAALAPTADAPPEVTEEMVEAAWRMLERRLLNSAGKHDVFLALEAALTAQKEG